MKRMICVFLTVFMLVTLLPVRSMAAEEARENVSYIYYEDGSYLKITIEEIRSASRAINNVTGSKRMDYNGSDGELYWSAVLRGSFAYDGTTAVCASSSCDVTIYGSSFYLDSKETGKSGNCAYVSFVIGRKILGIQFMPTTYEMTLYCDKNGNLS